MTFQININNSVFSFSTLLWFALIIRVEIELKKKKKKKKAKQCMLPHILTNMLHSNQYKFS